MPTYAYRCTVCRHGFERVLAMADKSIVLCPLCEERAERVVTAVPVIQASARSADSPPIEEESLSDGALHCGCAWHHCRHQADAPPETP